MHKNIQGLACDKVSGAYNGKPFIFGLLTFLEQNREEITIKFIQFRPTNLLSSRALRALKKVKIYTMS